MAQFCSRTVADTAAGTVDGTAVGVKALGDLGEKGLVPQREMGK